MSEELDPSILGTREYWDKIYQRDRDNFVDIGDKGEDWFGEDAVERMLDWIEENEPSHTEQNIIDIGTGNGHLLFGLQDRGYDSTNLYGIDYSTDAISLCNAISTEREKSKNLKTPSFKHCDILQEAQPSTWPNEFDLILDKGTYDAICLSNELIENTKPSDIYPQRLASILKKNGRILITSCNWTREELVKKFTIPEPSLKFHSALKVPSFTYGGHTGQTTVTLVFEKS